MTHPRLHNDANREINRLHLEVQDLRRVRKTVTITTPAPLAPNGEFVGTVVLARAYRLYVVQSDAPMARLRLYTTAAKRTADASRSFGGGFTSAAGVVLDVRQSTAGAFEVLPMVDGFQNESTPSENVPFALKNEGTTSTNITITITFMRTE
jgi:hypothetical protein